ncbi:MAG: SsrA-binding protein SmpB [Cellulomonadaceae bacterium]|jgi:SsrA-binding protein|nr:SsrA-binding protein SmpB [Cellulomonadaceae bacterium]
MSKGATKQVPEAWAHLNKPKKPATRGPLRTVVASNKKARHDYTIEDVFEAGMVLSGTEVKALRMGRASLVDGFVLIDRNEAWLEGVHIPEYSNGNWNNHAPRRKRKLLLHHDEILRLGRKVQEKGHTIIPLQLYFLDGRAKVEIALARGKKEYDKRQSLREAQDNREAHRAMRERTKLGE